MRRTQNRGTNAPASGQYLASNSSPVWDSIHAPGPRQDASQSAYPAYSQGSMNSLQQQLQAMPLPPSAPLPRDLLPRAPTQLDDRPPDYWHSNKDLLSINFGSKEEYPYSISFKPTSGPYTCKYGVALLNLEIGRWMLFPKQPIDDYLPPHATRYTNAAFLIDWPGYRQHSCVLTLIDPCTNQHVTRAQLGAQVTQHFKDFINTRTEEDFFEGNGIQLGIDGVMYDQVRLSELYTTDGMTFRAQWGLNANYLYVEA
ncbi:hypothetical protein GGX14DRAFT_470939 [Mycena pura]|uniref:Uncharacterized protein n=1 Tax=Mycena pura TaxID=153505 RepID=A0AAD6UYL5_9AGAR|nr:hypothetical protein GGX14DRAFT_470939 [Mycena pura]